jgi:hypothetical protein
VKRGTITPDADDASRHRRGEVVFAVSAVSSAAAGFIISRSYPVLLLHSGRIDSGKRGLRIPPEAANRRSIEQAARDTAPPDVVTPELALIDPELARRAREQLPLPGTIYRPRWVPRDRASRAAVVVPAAAVELPQPTQPPAPVRAGARLLAVAALVPVSVALALVADLRDSGGQTFEGAAPSDRGSSAPSAPPRPQAGPPGSRTLPPAAGGSSAGAAAPRAAKRSAPAWARRYVVNGVVTEIGSRPAAIARALGRPTARARNGEYCHVMWPGRGLTIVLVARRTKNPCTQGRVVGGFATGATWRTGKGLHVGASLTRLRRRYPRARRVGSGWWKLGSVRAPRSRTRIPLHAHVTGGRVDKILVN